MRVLTLNLLDRQQADGPARRVVARRELTALRPDVVAFPGGDPDGAICRSGSRGPLLDVAGCRLVLDQAHDGVWASDHVGVLADLRRPLHAPGTWA